MILRTPCTKRDCAAISGDSNQTDLEIYNIQDALYFNGTELQIIAECPTGYTCPPGVFPHVFKYPPGTFEIPAPTIVDGQPIVLSLQGCESNVSVVLPPGSSAQTISEAADFVIQQVAEQQARCDAVKIAGPPTPIPILLSSLAQYVCKDSLYSTEIQGSSHPIRIPITFSTTNLPAWINLTQNEDTLFLTGNPSGFGDFTFTVSATAPGVPPGSGQKTYTLTVVGIATASPLPDAEIDTLYGEALDASSIPGTLTWSAVGLPSWLDINVTTGSLFGTPVTGDEGDVSFTVTASNGTVSCEKTFDLTINPAASCDQYTAIVWDGGADLSERDNGGFYAGPGTGTVGGTCATNTFNLTASTPAIVGTVSYDTQQAFYYWTGTFQYTGPASSCCINATFTGDAAVPGVAPAVSGDTHCGFQVIQDGNIVLFSSPVGNGSPQILSLPFTLADSPTPSTIDFIVQISAVVRAGAGLASPTMACTLVGSYGPC